MAECLHPFPVIQDSPCQYKYISIMLTDWEKNQLKKSIFPRYLYIEFKGLKDIKCLRMNRIKRISRFKKSQWVLCKVF